MFAIRVIFICSLLQALFAVVPTAGAGPIDILHSFSSGSADGREPTGLLLDGSTLYGTTLQGGHRNGGVIYSLKTDGSGFSLLHSFSGYPTDGNWAHGNLTRSGTTLYGTTGATGGSIYSIETNGSDFTLLHQYPWPGLPTDPRGPYAGVTLAGDTLYGTTNYGGTHRWGTAFAVGVDGSDYTSLHNFGDGPHDGILPYGTALTVSDGVVYGMTTWGGDTAGNGNIGDGTLFRMNADGTDYSILHNFHAFEYPFDGGRAQLTGLQLVGSRLYGVTSKGGQTSLGVLFGINTDGSDFEVLHTFGRNGDGANPMGALAVTGSTLFGVTPSGGAFGRGTLYSINLDGSGYSILHSFAGGPADGANPYDGGLVVVGGTLFGTTMLGGEYGFGTVYSLAIPSPGGLCLLVTSSFVFAKRRR